VKSMRGLRKLFVTLVNSLPSLLHVGVMLLLLFFVYAVAGMALFGDIQIYGNPDLSAMSSDVNFENFYIAMMMLFRISTGEAWNNLMHDCFYGARCAEPPHDPVCGSTFQAVVYFISFMVIGSFVFVNLFIAVIIEKLFESESQEDSTGDMSIMAHDLDSFIEAWSRIAPDGSDYIPTVFLPALLQDVNPPLGFKGEIMRKSAVIRLVARLGIRDHDGKVNFFETLWRLAAMVVGVDMRDVASFQFLRDIDKMVIRKWPLPNNRGHGGVLFLAAQVIVAMRVQALWRSKRAKRKLFEVVRSMSEAHRKNKEELSMLAKVSLSDLLNDATVILTETEDDDRYAIREESPLSSPCSFTVPVGEIAAARSDELKGNDLPSVHSAMACEFNLALADVVIPQHEDTFTIIEDERSPLDSFPCQLPTASPQLLHDCHEHFAKRQLLGL